jgi:hypothetical protein
MSNYKKEMQSFAKCFEAKEFERANNETETLTVFTDEAMQKESPLCDYYQVLSEIIHSNNIGENFAYQTVGQVVDELADLEDINEAEEWESSEFADSNTDIYTAGLTAWLASSVYNVEYLGQAVAELDATEGIAILQGAQYLALQELADETRNAIVKFLEDKDTEEEEA